MTLKSITTAAAVFFFCFMPLRAQESEPFVHYKSDGYDWPKDQAVLEKLDKWQDLKFGILIHWGLYSVPGIVESWNLCNEDWVVRPEGSTYEGYKQWYWGLAEDFNPIAFNPAQWAQISEDAGMKYVVFTTKHHDGFCMYDTKYSDFSIAKGPFGGNPRKDVARHVFDAYKDKGFMIGAYFSKPDWHCEWFWNPYYATPDRHPNYNPRKHPEWWKNYVQYTQNQLREVTSYSPLDILWLDGGWISGEQVGLDGILKEARKINPGLISVDRTIRGQNENYQTPEKLVPDKIIDNPWESCMPLGNDWGWTPDPHYKPAGYIINTLIEIVAKGGCFLLGVGPTAQGLIDDDAAAILKEIGNWLALNGEAIYATRPAAVCNDGNVWFTKAKDGKTMYAIYALPQGGTLPESITWSSFRPKGKVTVLSNGRKLKASVKKGKVTVDIPSGLAQESIALKFECK